MKPLQELEHKFQKDNFQELRQMETKYQKPGQSMKNIKSNKQEKQVKKLGTKNMER